MCGRYVSFTEPDELARHFDVAEVATEPLPARYNVAPTDEVYAIVERAQQRRLGTLHWGLVPYWASDPKKGASPINARLESIEDKPMFRDAFARRRCILPADGFYEWQARPGGTRKQPYYIHAADGQPLAFAGLWSSWRPKDDPDAAPLYSCAIVTTAARGAVRDLHSRMPLALPRDAWKAWLDVEGHDPAAVRALVDTLATPRFEAYPVSTLVNSVRNDGPELLARAS